jgi:hypothetical protein
MTICSFINLKTGTDAFVLDLWLEESEHPRIELEERSPTKRIGKSAAKKTKAQRRRGGIGLCARAVALCLKFNLGGSAMCFYVD